MLWQIFTKWSSHSPPASVEVYKFSQFDSIDASKLKNDCNKAQVKPAIKIRWCDKVKFFRFA